jgi:DNA-binding transcriptional ArsR family regulator
MTESDVPSQPWEGASQGSVMPGEGESRPRSAPYIPPRAVHALAVPARVRIIAILNERAMSPTQYAAESDLDRTAVARHFSKLEKLGYLEVAKTISTGKRGRPEKIYRAIQAAIFDDAMWERLPEQIRQDYSGVIWETYGQRVTEAMKEGTFDLDLDRHFSWSPLKLNKRGWTQLQTGLNEFLDWAMELEVEAVESGEALINMTIGLAGFRSPSTAQDGPPVR